MTDHVPKTVLRVDPRLPADRCSLRRGEAAGFQPAVGQPYAPFPVGSPLRYDGRDVLRLTLAAFVLLLSVMAFACGDGGADGPTPEGPTTVSLTKTVVEEGPGEFRFTLKLTNEGDNAAVNLNTSDFWDQGLEVTAIGSVEDKQPKAIEDRGLEFILREFAAGKSVELVYTARCRESGEWVNAAAATAANADPAEAKLTVTCP